MDRFSSEFQITLWENNFRGQISARSCEGGPDSGNKQYFFFGLSTRCRWGDQCMLQHTTGPKIDSIAMTVTLKCFPPIRMLDTWDNTRGFPAVKNQINGRFCYSWKIFGSWIEWKINSNFATIRVPFSIRLSNQKQNVSNFATNGVAIFHFPFDIEPKIKCVQFCYKRLAILI